MTALRVLPPDELRRRGRVDPGDHRAPSSELLDAGAAYRVDDDIYFPIAAAPRFGNESNYDRDDDAASCSASAAATRDRAGKRDPLDSLLWRGRRPGEPFWDTPLGAGPPGLAHRVLA